MKAPARQMTVPLEEVVRSTLIQEEALLRLLIRKGILTKDEVLEEIRAVHREMTPEKTT